MTSFRGPDPKPLKRIRDAKVMKRLHGRRVWCVLCGNRGSLHHVYPRGQGGDDVSENLVGLCGDGVRGHHGLIESGDVTTRMELGDYLYASRPDTVLYLRYKLGFGEGSEWLRQRFFMRL